MSENKELKPCPFCGSDKIEIEVKGNAYTKKRSVTIKCRNCFCKRTTGAIKYTLEWCEETAIKLWNTRQSSALLDEAVEFVENIANWKSAYPESVFPPVTQKELEDMCQSAGISMDRLSASILRSCVKGWSDSAEILLDKLTKEKS